MSIFHAHHCDGMVAASVWILCLMCHCQATFVGYWMRNIGLTSSVLDNHKCKIHKWALDFFLTNTKKIPFFNSSFLIRFEPPSASQNERKRKPRSADFFEVRILQIENWFFSFSLSKKVSFYNLLIFFWRKQKRERERKVRKSNATSAGSKKESKKIMN